MAITKKMRFEVFKRDGFRCAYCGKTPPEVILEVDHITPKSKKGKDDINNLITSCFDCNRGKRDIPLNRIPNQMTENLEILKSKENQIKEYRKYCKKIERRINKDISEIDNIFQETYPGRCLNDKFKTVSVKLFIKTLPLEEVKDAINIATSYKENDYEACVRYFCGICWRKINQNKDPEDIRENSKEKFERKHREE